MGHDQLSDWAILADLGRRLRRARLDRNLSQQGVADQAGLSRSTVSEIERGVPASLQSLVRILRVLGRLADLEAFLPDLGPSPLQLAQTKGRQRRRASRQPAGEGGGGRGRRGDGGGD